MGRRKAAVLPEPEKGNFAKFINRSDERGERLDNNPTKNNVKD